MCPSDSYFSIIKIYSISESKRQITTGMISLIKLPRIRRGIDFILRLEFLSEVVADEVIQPQTADAEIVC